jgi:hypothetical protein
MTAGEHAGSQATQRSLKEKPEEVTQAVKCHVFVTRSVFVSTFRVRKLFAKLRLSVNVSSGADGERSELPLKSDSGCVSAYPSK